MILLFACNGCPKDKGQHTGEPEETVCDLVTLYNDGDGDGYGAEEIQACPGTAGTAENGDDCDDERDDVHPGADEVCEDVDHDCDGTDGQDEDSSGWYADRDGDGHGDPEEYFESCTTEAIEAGARTNTGDCDDSNASAHEDAEEVVGDEIDQDCDGSERCYVDADLDGARGTSTVESADNDCGDAGEAPAWAAEDCDESRADIHPGAEESDCEDPTDYNCDESVGYADEDGDGFAACQECWDLDPSIHPGADEWVGDDIDQDCDGGEVCSVDADDDGYTDGSGSTVASVDDTDCHDSGEATEDTPEGDCDEARADVSPAGVEVCDPDNADEDCDGLSDDADDGVDSSTWSDWYPDGDGDGYGAATTERLSCDALAGEVADNTDCDDSDPDFHPGATEDDCADPNDYNCDGSTGYADEDGDGWAACEECDDGEPAVYPYADERCDDIDHDCDGAVNEDDSIDASTWYLDADGDGYGYEAYAWTSCEAPDGYISDYSDCDDSSSVISPEGAEVCDEDGVDEDCDGLANDDDASVGDTTTWYLDADEDGHGDPDASVNACVQPDGYVASDDDCDDSTPLVSPGAVETCDGLDDDCDGTTDEDDAFGAPIWYADTDGDGFGDPTSYAPACELPTGYVDDATDCDDRDDAVYPGAPETCDGVDHDCDGATDEVDSLDVSTWYADVDGDRYGDPGASTLSCDAPTGSLADGSDCDDRDDDTHPGATEATGDEVDQSCDGMETCYADADRDGYRDDAGTTTTSADADCDDAGELDQYAPSGDCDDTDDRYHPSASESDCEDPNDYNCDGLHGTVDNDGDGYVSCQDCDDNDPDISPAATEICDDAGTDEDCDGKVDDADSGVDLSTGSSWYADADHDGYGDAADQTRACDPPTGSVADDTDCDDGDDTVFPGATETTGDEVDSDCDGGEICYTDADNDGYADDGGATVTSGDADCQDGREADQDLPRQDCDDGDDTINPDAIDDVCDQIDVDCDGYDGDLAVDATGTTYSGVYTSIQDAIDDALGGELVCVAPGTYTENLTVLNKEIQLVALACDGGAASHADCREDTTLDGDAAGAVLTFNDNLDAGLITSASRVSGFTVQNGLATAGAGLVLRYASPTLDQLIITGNTVSSSIGSTGGGGLWAYGGDLSLRDVDVSDNTLTCTTGGTTGCNGGGIYGRDLGTLTLDQVTLSGNTIDVDAGLAQGGGLYARTITRLDLTDVDVIGNSVSGSDARAGGAYLNAVTAGSWARGGVTDNDASGSAGGGGGLSVDDSALTLSDLDVADNSAFGGAGINIGGDNTLSLTGVDLTDNIATDYAGGGLRVYGSGDYSLTDCTLTGNQAQLRGGGASFEAHDGNPDVALDGVTVSGNAVSNSDGNARGGGLYVYMSPLTMTESELWENTVSASGSAMGGGLYLEDGASLLAYDSTLVGNTVSGGQGLGGGMYLYYETVAGDIDLSFVDFHSNTVSATSSYAEGGGLRIYNGTGSAVSATFGSVGFGYNSATATDEAMTGYPQANGGGAAIWEVDQTWSGGDILYSNTASSDRLYAYGGGLYLSGGSASFAQVIFEDNTVSAPSAANGGGLWASTLDALDVDYIELHANSAKYGAGAILSDIPEVEIDRGILYENVATGNGGALYISRCGSASAPVALSDLDITDNQAASGGGVALVGCEVTMTDCTFTANEASASGGGLHQTYGGTYALTDCTFSENSAGNGAGAGAQMGHFYGTSDTSITLDGVTFSANTATCPWLSRYGGAGLNVTQPTGTTTTLSLTDTYFLDNVTSAPVTGDGSCYGGGLYFSGEAITVSGSHFIGNQASSNGEGGGGGAKLVAVNADLDHVRFLDNTDLIGGGGLSMTATGTISNAIFAGNTTGYYAGALHVSGEVQISNSTFLGNAVTGAGGAGGGAVSTAGGESYVNVSFIENTSASGGDVLRLDGADTPTFSYIHLLDNGSDPFEGLSDPSGADVLTCAPAFEDDTPAAYSDWDLRLDALDTCLTNTGDPSILDANGSRSDIGAYGGPGASGW